MRIRGQSGGAQQTGCEICNDVKQASLERERRSLRTQRKLSGHLRFSKVLQMSLELTFSPLRPKPSRGF